MGFWVQVNISKVFHIYLLPAFGNTVCLSSYSAYKIPLKWIVLYLTLTPACQALHGFKVESAKPTEDKVTPIPVTTQWLHFQLVFLLWSRAVHPGISRAKWQEVCRSMQGALTGGEDRKRETVLVPILVFWAYISTSPLKGVWHSQRRANRVPPKLG